MQGRAEMNMLVTQLEEKARMVRLFSLLLVIDMLRNTLNPAAWILGESQSIIGTVARLSSSADALAACWLFMAVLMLPYMYVTIVGRHAMLATRLAILSMAGSGALWAFLAWLARNLDYDNTLWIFGGNSVISIAVSYIFALAINESQLTKQKAKATHAA
jgi:hypothetical protein